MPPKLERGARTSPRSRARAHATSAVYSNRTRGEEIVVRVRRQVSGALAAVLVGRGRSPCRSDRRPPRAVLLGPTLHGRGPRCGRPLLPVLRQRRLRRPALRPRPHLHAAGASPGAACRPVERRGDDRPRRHPGPRPVQPRSARPGRSQAITVNGKPASEVAPPAAGADVEGAAYWQVQDDAARIWELTVQPRPKIKEGQTGDDRRRPTAGRQPADRHRGRALRLGDDAGRCHGGERARRLDDLVPGQRPPDRQGDVRLRDHGPRRQGRGRQRAARTEPTTDDGWTTWYWDAPDPQASYLTHRLGRRLRPDASPTPAACRSSTPSTTT